MKIVMFMIAGVVILGALLTAFTYYRAQTIPRPDFVNNAEILPCPSSPNCVSTVDTDGEHGMDPIAYTGTLDEARAKLLAIIDTLPKATVVTADGAYVYVETRSPTMGFPDDVQFVFDDDAKLIHFRSAARMGQSDLGKNRERLDYISAEFAK